MATSFVGSTDLVVAFGPLMPDWGSWEWVGADMVRELSGRCRTVTFEAGEVPPAHVIVLVKHLPDPMWLGEAARRSEVLYCPVDAYGSASAIDADGGILRRCRRIIIHCERLRRYFAPYAPVEYLDHHVKFIAPPPAVRRPNGPVIWIGARSNLEPLVAWVNAHPLAEELVVMSNFEDGEEALRPSRYGFRAGGCIRLQRWSAELHQKLLGEARAAVDIKGEDFRSRHKPPAKAIDFLASGVPLAVNLDSSPVEHLARLGFDVPAPIDQERWFSEDYWLDTQRFGQALRELLSRERIGRRWWRIIRQVLDERNGRRC